MHLQFVLCGCDSVCSSCLIKRILLGSSVRKHSINDHQLQWLAEKSAFYLVYYNFNNQAAWIFVFRWCELAKYFYWYIMNCTLFIINVYNLFFIIVLLFIYWSLFILLIKKVFIYYLFAIFKSRMYLIMLTTLLKVVGNDK